MSIFKLAAALSLRKSGRCADEYPFGLDPISLRREGAEYVCAGCDGEGKYPRCFDPVARAYFDCTDIHCRHENSIITRCEVCDGVGKWPGAPSLRVIGSHNV